MYCRHCRAEIDRLNYSANYIEYGKEWGTCDFDGGDEETSDSACDEHNIEETEYECPNCGRTIDPDEDLMETLDDEEDEDVIGDEDEEENNEETANVRTRLPDADEQLLDDDNNVRTPFKTIACPECKKVNIYEGENETIICDSCNCEIIIN
jgi:ribosomal protein S27E